MSKIILLITIMLLMLTSGCNNPNGGSVVSANHTPLLKPPGPFSFSTIRAANDSVLVTWQASNRASEYKFYMGTSSSDVSTLVSTCELSSRRCELAGLNAGTTYYFRVEAINIAGTQQVKNIGSALSVGSFDITSSSVADGTMNISWSSSAGATSYNIVYGTSAGSYSQTRTNVTSPYALTGLNNGVTYYAKVVAVNASNGYLMSDTEASGSPYGAPTAPSDLTATSSPSQVDLEWNSVPGATSYKIYKGTSSGNLAEINSSVTTNTFSDSSVTPGQTYFYSVKAYNGYDSAASSEVSTKVIASFATTSVVVGPAAQQLTVTWPNVAGAETYDVYYGTDFTNLSSSVTSATSPLVLSGLSGSSPYYVRIIAKNAVGSTSSQVSSTLPSATPIATLTAPTGLTISAVHGVVTLNWTAVDGAASYQILKGTTSGHLSALPTSIAATSFTDTDISNGTNYFYAVKAYNGLYSASSSEVLIKPIADFTISSATAASTSSIDVSWSAVAGADTYDVLYGTVSGTYTGTSSGATTTRTLTGLSANTNYYIVVKAKNAIGVGTSHTSAQVSAKTSTAAPTALAASSTPGQVTLTWTAPAGASSFKIYRSTVSGSSNYTEIEPSSSGSPFTDTDITNGVTYFYAIKANNGSDSAYSSEVSIRPIEAATTPTLAIVTSTSASVTWPAVTGAASYDILYGTSSSSLTSTSLNAVSPKTITGLTSGTTYHFAIRAKNTVGAGTNVTSSSASLLMSAGAPTGVVATAGASRVDLSWNTVATATSYNIYRGTSSGSHTQVASNVTTLTYADTDVTLANGTQYYYVVRAYNGAESANSSEVTAKPIATPSFDSLVATNSSITFTWTTPAGATAFDILYRTSPTGTYSTLSNKTSGFAFTGLTANTTYYFVLKAKNTTGTGAFVNSTEVSQITSLGAPSGLTASTSNGIVTLNWTAVSGATSYKVYRSTTSGSFSATPYQDNVATNSLTDSGATAGTTYYYVVTAYNGVNSAQSAQVSMKPIQTFTITNATVLSSTSIELSWPTVAGADSYDVKYGTNPASLATLASQTSPKTFTGLTSNSTYYFVVVAKNSVGGTNTQLSNQASATTSFGAPSGLTASADNNQVGLNWNSVSGATTYKIYRGTSSGSRSYLGTSNTNAYLDLSAANGTSYYYTVRADNGTESADSSEVAAKPISTFSLTAATAASASTITLTWESATGADSYDVQYGTNSGVYLLSVSGVTSSYTLSSLDSGTIYYISIRARNTVGAGTTKNSNERNAKTALGAPATLALTATPGSVAVSWGAVTGATNYNVYRSEATGGPYSQIASAVVGTSYTDSGRSNGTSYFYVVRSYNGLESVNSLEKSVMPIESFTVTSATALTASTVQVTWPAVTGADAYDIIYRPASGGASTTLSSQTSPTTISGLSSATRYFFLVKAKNSVGVTTNFSSAEVEATTATAAPSTLTATTSTGSIILNWTAATGATSYKIYKGTTSGVYTLLSTVTGALTTTDSDIVNGTQYYYVVRAFNGTESVNSTEATGKPIGNFTIATVTPISSTSLEIVWNAASGAASYDLYYRTSSGSYGAPITGATSPRTLTGLTANTTYYFKVLARNAVGSGTSVYSNEVYKITPLAAPVGLAATAEDSVINLAWTTNGATSYKVFRGETSGSLTELASGVSGGTYSDSTVSNGTTYYYAVKAYNGSDSALSSEVFKQPIALPVDMDGQPISGTEARINWTESAGAETYKIRYGTEPGNYTDEVLNVTPGTTITGLTSGGSYYGHIIASNTIGGGTTVYSEEFRFRTNATPQLTFVADQEIVSDTSAYIDFELNDEDNILNCSNTYLSASSSNTSVVDSAGFSFSGTYPYCQLRVTPRASAVGVTSIGITATDGVSTTSISFSLNVIGCVVDSIAWVTQPPATTAAAATFATAPKVKLLKADGSLCTTNYNPVSVDIGTDASIQQDAAVSGTISTTPVAGYATFSNINIQRAGTGHTLVVSQGSISSPDSSTFNITALSASLLVFSQPPTSTIKNATLSPFPEVRVADTYGNYTTSNTTVSLTLQVVSGSGSLAGTTSKTTTSGAASFTNLTINNIGTFNLRATNTSGYPSITSPNFSVINSTPRTVAGVYEMIQAPIIYPYGGGSRLNYPRSSFPVGTTNSDGTKTFEWRFVATNPHTSASSTVYLYYNGSSIASRSIPANTTTPTTYSITSMVSTFSSNVNINLRIRYGAAIVHSSKFIVKQTNANKTQSYIPLSMVSSNSMETITTNITTNTTSAASPNDIHFPAYRFNRSRFDNVSTAALTYSAKATSGGNACVSLWNKTTNRIISTESCTSSTTETYVSTTFDAALLPSDADIEVRFRSTSGTATLYKAGLILNLVGINDFTNVEIANQASTGLNTNTTFSHHRFMGFPTSYGLVTPNFYLKCRVKATTAGSASLVLKDYGTSTTSQTPTSTISASTINISNQTLSTALSAGPLATTSGNYLMMNFAYGGSGTFSLGGCFFETEAAY